MEKIKIIHILRDDKFVDSPVRFFEQDSRFDNEFVLVVNSPNYKYRLIKNTEKVKLLYNKEMVKKELQRDDYSAVFFYSLPSYHLFRYIPDDKIVIWWAWGFDIYGSDRFIDVPLYKPITEEYINKTQNTISNRVKTLLKHIPFVCNYRYGNKKLAIRRVDYFQPVIHLEYELLQKVNGFKAKEFYYPQAHSYISELEGAYSNYNNNIIIGHSATLINNHLDVWNRIKNYIPNSSIVYFPISYGDLDFADYLTSKISPTADNIRFLKDFMPANEYFKVVDSCSYAVFGVLREAAMGNINRCVAKGVKLFLYKDSIPYQQLKRMGCIVFAIEEIDENSFRIPLTPEQAENNRQCLVRDRDYVEYVRETAIAEMQNIVEKQKTEK